MLYSTSEQGTEMTQRKISQDELDKILRLHERWLMGADSGKRAILQDTDLQGANLQDANLQYAYLRGVNLQGVNLCGANLQGVNLRRASLQGANLCGANLKNANFCDADLQNVNLQDFDLSRTEFESADLRGAQFNQTIPHNCWITKSKWLRSDLPWWLGHPDQEKIVLCEE